MSVSTTGNKFLGSKQVWFAISCEENLNSKTGIITDVLIEYQQQTKMANAGTANSKMSGRDTQQSHALVGNMEIVEGTTIEKGKSAAATRANVCPKFRTLSCCVCIASYVSLPQAHPAFQADELLP